MVPSPANLCRAARESDGIGEGASAATPAFLPSGASDTQRWSGLGVAAVRYQPCRPALGCCSVKTKFTVSLQRELGSHRPGIAGTGPGSVPGQFALRGARQPLPQVLEAPGNASLIAPDHRGGTPLRDVGSGEPQALRAGECRGVGLRVRSGLLRGAASTPLSQPGRESVPVPAAAACWELSGGSAEGGSCPAPWRASLPEPGPRPHLGLPGSPQPAGRARLHPSLPWFSRPSSRPRDEEKMWRRPRNVGSRSWRGRGGGPSAQTCAGALGVWAAAAAEATAGLGMSGISQRSCGRRAPEGLFPAFPPPPGEEVLGSGL